MSCLSRCLSLQQRPPARRVGWSDWQGCLQRHRCVTADSRIDMSSEMFVCPDTVTDMSRDESEVSLGDPVVSPGGPVVSLDGPVASLGGPVSDVTRWSSDVTRWSGGITRWFGGVPRLPGSVNRRSRQLCHSVVQCTPG